MITTLIVLGLAIYVVASYVLVYRDLKRNPGPYGFGWLLLPFAPLLFPVGAVLVVWDNLRR